MREGQNILIDIKKQFTQTPKSDINRSGQDLSPDCHMCTVSQQTFNSERFPSINMHLHYDFHFLILFNSTF